MKRIALLGCGVVGRRVAEAIATRRESLERRIGDEIEVSIILVRDATRERGLSLARLTSSLRDVVETPRLDAAIEVLGGVDPAFGIVSRLLERGVGVVTANKSLVAARWNELHGAAAAGGAPLRFEASVGGAMPVVRALEALAGDRVDRIRAVLSGSCNLIIERCRSGAADFDSALSEARDRGLVEPDPAFDLSGRDTAEKLSILTALAGERIEPCAVDSSPLDALALDRAFDDCRAGARTLDALDADAVPRFTAEWRRASNGRSATARVALEVVPRTDPLFECRDNENVAVIDANDSGRSVLRAQGAGPAPTAATILGDLVEIVRAPREVKAARRAARPGPRHPTGRGAAASVGAGDLR